MNTRMILLVAVLLVGCAPSVKVTPNKLPDAYLYKPYKAKIRIINSKVVGRSINAKITSSSFNISPETKLNDQINYNNLIITGKPTSLEPISVYISGSTYGTNLTGTDFEKEYTINIRSDY